MECHSKMCRAVIAVLSFFLAIGSSSQESRSWFPEILEEESGLYLPDYSYAGYRFGEEPLPELKTTASVADFGAIPDDDKDDTTAFRKAIASLCERKGIVVLGIPRGRFILGEILFIRRGDFILQGAGSGDGGSVLMFSKAMKDMELPTAIEEQVEALKRNNKTEKGRLFSPFSWCGGVIWVEADGGEAEHKPLCGVSGGRRGNSELTVEDGSKVKTGDCLRIEWFNKDGAGGSLLEHVLGRLDVKIGVRLHENPEKPLVVQPITVLGVSGGTVKIKEPLLHDIRDEWNCRIATDGYMSGFGIENLRIEFPEMKYAGHHFEDGCNAIYLNDLADSWIRNVSVVDGDAAVLSDHCRNVTVERLEMSGRLAHYNIHFGSCYGMLARDFSFRADAFHSASFNTRARLCVFSGGKIAKGKLDQHCGLNHQNLFDNIEMGKGDDIFNHGGAEYWRPTAGAFNTFWNIRVVSPGKGGFIGSCYDAPEARIVGMRGVVSDAHFKYSPSPYVEGTNREGIPYHTIMNTKL